MFWSSCTTPQFVNRLPSAFWSFPWENHLLSVFPFFCSLSPQASLKASLSTVLFWALSLRRIYGNFIYSQKLVRQDLFPWCNCVKATGMSSQRAMQTSVFSILLFLPPRLRFVHTSTLTEPPGTQNENWHIMVSTEFNNTKGDTPTLPIS